MRKTIDESKIQEVFNAKTLAPYLGVSVRMVHNYRVSGLLPAIQSSRGRYIFLKGDVISFMVKDLGYEIGQ